jgi:hypothetical protein
MRTWSVLQIVLPLMMALNDFADRYDEVGYVVELVHNVYSYDRVDLSVCTYEYGMDDRAIGGGGFISC